MAESVLFYINQIYDGGAERVMTTLASRFSENGYSVILVTSFRKDGEYELASDVKRLSLEDSEIQQSFIKRNISRIRKLRSICKREKPDIVVSFMREPNCRALLATLGLPVKNIVSVRSDPNYEYAGIVGKILGKYLLPLADGCVFQTEEAKNWFPIKLQKKSKIILNPVKDDFYQVQRRPIPGRIVSCGRLEKEKNFSLLIDAFASLGEKYPEMELLIYGEGSLKANLQEQIGNLRMEERIFLMGATDNVAKVLSEASVFVLSSLYEGMPNALMEAMAVGVPCISTDCSCGGPRRLICSGENGILIKNDNKIALVESLKKLLDDSIMADELGARARESALDWQEEKIFMQWVEYVSALKKVIKD